MRALLAHDPDVPVAVAFESAIWELGHSSHQPDRPVLAHRRGWRPPSSLGVRAVTFDAEWAGRTDIAEKIETQLPPRLPVTFLGPRDRRAQWSTRWHVYDSLLPRQ